MTFDEINDFHNGAHVGLRLDKDGEMLLLSYLPGMRRTGLRTPLPLTGRRTVARWVAILTAKGSGGRCL